MACRRCGAAARKYEVGKCRQFAVVIVEIVLQAFDICILDRRMPGNAELAPQFEEVVLDLGETVAHRLRHAALCQHHTDGAVRLIDRAIGLDPGAVLLRPAAVTEAGGELEYATLADALSADSIETLDREAFLAVAARVGRVRLIDNVVLWPDGGTDTGLLLDRDSILRRD